LKRPTCAQDAPLIAVRAGGRDRVSFWPGAYREARPARRRVIGRSTRRLGSALGSGKACQGGIGRSQGAWSPARRHPVDHLWVVPACLLTRQQRGNGLGCPVGHRDREEPLGILTAAWAYRGRRGRAHWHALFEATAGAAAILVGGHSVLQGATVGGVGAGRWFYADAPLSSRGTPILSASGGSPQPNDRLSLAVGMGPTPGQLLVVSSSPRPGPRQPRARTESKADSAADRRMHQGRIGRRRPRGICPVMRSRTAVQPPSWAERPPRKPAGQKTNAAQQSNLIPAESIRNRCTEAIGLCSSRLTVDTKLNALPRCSCALLIDLATTNTTPVNPPASPHALPYTTIYLHIWPTTS
jgi:hypothetical protein